jgi:hypothetical protein
MGDPLPTLVCLECGERFSTRPELVVHWTAQGHGPSQVAADAIDRARFSVLGDDAPPPVRATEEPDR